MRSKELALRENAELATIAKEVDLTQTLQKNKLDMYFKLITEIGDTWKGNLAKEFDDGLNDEVLEYVGQVFKEEFEGFRRYGITTDGNRLDYGPALAALVDGSKTKIPAYRLSTEMIQNSIPLYDPRDVIKVTSKVQRKLLKNKSLDEFKSKTKVEGFNLYLDKYISIPAK